MTILVPVLAFIGLQFLAIQTAWFYYLLIFCNLIIFSLYYFAQAAKITKDWFKVLALPLLFLNSTILYSSILTNNSLIQLIYLFFLLALFIYLRNLYIYFFKPLKYKSQSLENANFLISFIVIFYSVGGILSLKNFIDLDLWQIIIPISIILFLMLFQLFWFYKIKFKNNLFFSIIIAFTLTEIVLASTYLPHTYSIIGLIIAILFYVSVGLSLLELTYKLTRKQVKIYLSLSIISLLLIFLSSSWI